jgi:hypothetical protein
VPATIITSDWRGDGAEHHAVAVQVQARGAGVHHLDRAAGQAEGHRPHRTGARPVEQDVRAGGQEAVLEQRVLAFGTQDVVEAAFRQRIARRIGQAADRPDHSHSSAPFFHT